MVGVLGIHTGLAAEHPKTLNIGGLELAVYPATLSSAHNLPSPGAINGTEYLLARTADGKWAIVVVTVVNGPLNLRYGSEFIGKGQQLKVNGADFPTLAAKGLHSTQELNRTATVTGKPIGEITLAARPGKDSGSGFLAEDEDLISVIRADNERVAKLGLRHPDLAKPLFHVWNMLLREYELGKLGRFKEDLVSFRYREREIRLKSERTKGFQESIFNDEVKGAFDIEIWRELDVDEHKFIQTRYAHLGEGERQAVVKRLTRIRTGEMEPYYIMRYGFYEGHTEYRVDPITITTVFGLRSLAEIENAFPGQLDTALTHHFTAQPDP